MIDIIMHIDSVAHYYLPDHSVLESVSRFYEDAWTKMLWVIGGGFAIVGLIFPILLARLQRNDSIKREKELITNMMSLIVTEIEKAKSELNESARDAIINEVSLLETNFNLLESRLKGMIFHLQGTTFFNNGTYAKCIHSFIRATKEYHAAGESTSKYKGIGTCVPAIKDAIENSSFLEIIAAEKYAEINFVESINELMQLPGMEMYNAVLTSAIESYNLKKAVHERPNAT